MTLPENNQIVIYEMPVRWMASDNEAASRQVDIATFEQAMFDRLDELQSLGINAIELLPVQDSPDTLNWGYGTRFFFAPDIDLGFPVDLKFFIKRCHQRGIRVILDVVMNHCKKCPLEHLAFDWYLTHGAPGRDGWGGTLMLYRQAAPGGFYAAREFHYEMAEYWIREYHIDGFRIDEFKSIDHWEFIQTFHDRAWAAQTALFPDRPFLVIAEDSNRRFQISRDGADNPNGRKLVDSIWNFSYRDEARLLITNQIQTSWGQPSRTDRIQALVSGRSMWDGLPQAFREGAGDLSQAINYLTSHDVKDGRRLMNYIFAELIKLRTSHPTLQRNEVEIFYVHPETNQNGGARVVAYVRTGGRSLGAAQEVAVVGNCGAENYPAFDIPWPWGHRPFHECATPARGGAPQLVASQTWLRLSLAPFQFRVFVIH